MLAEQVLYQLVYVPETWGPELGFPHRSEESALAVAGRTRASRGNQEDSPHENGRRLRVAGPVVRDPWLWDLGPYLRMVT